MEIQCDDCDRKITVTKSQWDLSDGTCKECGGYFSTIENEDEEEYTDAEDTITCDECDNKFDEKEIIEFDSGHIICKKCIDRAYPRPKTEVIEKIVEKPVFKFVDRKSEGSILNQQESYQTQTPLNQNQSKPIIASVF